MSFTARMWVPNRRGRADLHYSNPDINVGSVVHIAVSEATPRDQGAVFGLAQDWRHNFGAASITVQNVSVRQGGVDFYVFVDWDSPINLSVDITVFEIPAIIVIGQ